MTESEIRALLKKKNATMTAVADAVGVSETSVRRVIRGESKSRRIANTIALFLGVRLEDLWPGAYPNAYSRRSPQDVCREIKAAAMRANAERAA